VYIPHVQHLLDVLEIRFLPTIGDLDAEAAEVQKRVCQEISESPADEFSDASEAAEFAFEEGLRHYTRMSDVRQAVLNAFAPILYHTWEQQLLTFHRRQVLHPSEENDKALMKREVLSKRLTMAGL
jgi:hypothetical protein